MPLDVRLRCLELRIRCRVGYLPNKEEFDFLNECYAKWPDEYNRLGDEAYEATRPDRILN